MEEKKTTIFVKPDKIRLANLLDDINEGKINIPVFQRDFVWKKDQMKNLFDSISKGYPIGSLLFWKPEREYKTLNKIGPYKAPTPKLWYYVLDGFQRISTLFGVLINPKHFNKTENDIKEYLIYYNLETTEFDFIKSKQKNSIYHIPLYKIIDTFEYLDFIQEIKNSKLDKIEQNKLINNAKEINRIFLDYHIPFVEIVGGDIRSAVEIFSRTNSTGTDISEDFMLSALSYNVETGFLLSTAISEFINSLNIYNFEDLKRDTVLNAILNTKGDGKIYFDVKIENLLEKNFDLQYFSSSVFNHLKQAIDFLYKKLILIDVRLLPYPTQLIFISEFFRINPEPTTWQYEILEEWFWTTTYSNYFTLYSLSQQRIAYQEFLNLVHGNKNARGIYKVDIDMAFNTAKYPDKINFTGVRPKALQLFYLKSISENYELQEREGIKEMYISNKRERSAANIIFRFASEYESDKNKKHIDDFIMYSSLDVLHKHFITQEMVSMYALGNIDEFIRTRESLIKKKEREFVSKLNIKYIN